MVEAAGVEPTPLAPRIAHRLAPQRTDDLCSHIARIRKHRQKRVDTMDAMKRLEEELACEAVVQQTMN